MHWSERYVGQRYVKDSMDCAGWAARILAEQFGKRLELPSERAQGLRPRSRQIAEQRDHFAARTEHPAEGDGVLMLSRGNLWHIGIYAVIAGEGWVVHAMEGFGQVVCHRVRQLELQGLKLEGYYRWR
jgi:hypothetical protein